MATLISIKRNISFLYKVQKFIMLHVFYIIWQHAQNIHKFKIVSTICIIMNLCTLCEIRSHFFLWDLILQLTLLVTCICFVLPKDGQVG